CILEVTEKVRIGWSLTTKEGILKLQALNKCYYVTFGSRINCNKRKGSKYHDATPIIPDILALAGLNRFSFHHVPRNLVQYVDHLAKKA
ncbi:hypothetical protein IGI04_029014, partial [Brassica rapa subsp. trilocularis]